MTTFEELDLMLYEIAEALPNGIDKELNGGIFLSEDIKMHPESGETGNLYIMGEYHNDRKGYGGLGRYIVIYYGSFLRLYPHLSAEQLRRELKRVVLHEFTHHLESLSGQRDLEYKDEDEINKYRRICK